MAYYQNPYIITTTMLFHTDYILREVYHADNQVFPKFTDYKKETNRESKLINKRNFGKFVCTSKPYIAKMRMSRNRAKRY
jgi:hypothetical protein